MIPNDTFIIGSLSYSLWLLALYNTTYMPKATYCQRKMTKLWHIGFVTIYSIGKTATYIKTRCKLITIIVFQQPIQ